MDTIYNELVDFLKQENKTFDDIIFIESYNYVYDENESCLYKFEIAKKDFINIAKEEDIHNISDDLKIVGKDWWISTDTNDGFFDFYEIPKKPKQVMNLAKELLLSDRKASYILGIAFDEEY